MKKRLLVLFLTACMAFSMTACGTKEEAAKDSETAGDEAEIDRSAIGTSTLVELGEYRGLAYEPYDATVSDEELEEEIQYMLSNSQIPAEVVTETSYVNIDYVGKRDGEAFDGGTASGVTLSIENSGYIDGFAESIVGMEVGETKDCPMTFPEDYHAEELQGADVVFTIMVNDCYVRAEAVDEEFANSEGYDSVEAMYEAVRADYEAYKQENAQSDMEYQLIQAAIDNSTFDINEDEVAVYISDLESQYTSYAAQYGYDLESYVTAASGMTMEEFDEQNREIALYRIQSPLVLSAIAEAEGLEVSDDEYEGLAQKYVEYYGLETVAELEETYTKETVMKQLVSDLGVDYLVANAVANEVTEAE